MSEQEMNLASILAIVTNPEMVAKNIQKLQTDMVSARAALKEVEDKHKQALATLSAAKDIENSASDRHKDIDNREIDLKKKEQHWLEKDAQQKETEKAFNEIKLQHAARIREVDNREGALSERFKELSDREIVIRTSESDTKNAYEAAHKLKKEYEDKIESIKSFAKVVG